MFQNLAFAVVTIAALLYGAFEIGSPAANAINSNIAKLNSALGAK